MKRLIYILVIGLVVVLCSYSLLGREVDVAKEVGDAIMLGQSDAVAEHLAPKVSVMMYGAESMCSKSETEMVLREFFRRNRPSQFMYTYDDGCFKGNLTTANGKSYELKFIIKNVDNKDVITNFCVK